MKNYLRKLIPQNDSDAFWLSFFLSILFCVIILFIVSPVTGLSKNFGSGNDGYIQLARNIAAGNGYVFEKNGAPVFHRPPLYPLFLVPITIFPENMQRYIIVIPQSILVGFIGMMIFKISSKLYNQTVAVVALLLFLVNPWVYWNVKNPMTPILQTFLYLVFTYFTAMELFNKTKFKTLSSGLIIGISGGALALTHAAMLPVIMIFILVLFAGAIFRNKKRILTSIAAGVIVVCLIAPWTYRNWIVFHKFIPVSGGGGLAYFNGNVHWAGIEPEPQKAGETYIDASLRVLGIEGSEETLTHWKGFKDIELEELANQKMTENIKNHPALFIKKVILNSVEYYFPVFTYHFLAVKEFSIEQLALTGFHFVLWIFALLSVFYWRQKSLLLLTAIIFYAVWYFPFATFIGHSLYTFGTIPFLCVLSAAGIIKIFSLQSSIFSFKSFLTAPLNPSIFK